jgi:hypothetical protein
MKYQNGGDLEVEVAVPAEVPAAAGPKGVLELKPRRILMWDAAGLMRRQGD